MKPLLLALCVLFALGGASGQQLPGSHRQDIRSADMAGEGADAQPFAGPEVAKTTGTEF